MSDEFLDFPPMQTMRIVTADGRPVKITDLRVEDHVLVVTVDFTEPTVSVEFEEPEPAVCAPGCRIDPVQFAEGGYPWDLGRCAQCKRWFYLDLDTKRWCPLSPTMLAKVRSLSGHSLE